MVSSSFAEKPPPASSHLLFGFSWILLGTLERNSFLSTNISRASLCRNSFPEDRAAFRKIGSTGKVHFSFVFRFPPAPFLTSPRPFEIASEMRSWALYYSLPILYFYLPEEFYTHWSYLVAAFWILLSPSITPRALRIARNFLEKYSSEFNSLYGEDFPPPHLHSCSGL
jgi:hypothetical protein